MKLCIVVLSAIGVIAAIGRLGRARSSIAPRSGSSFPIAAADNGEPER